MLLLENRIFYDLCSLHRINLRQNETDDCVTESQRMTAGLTCNQRLEYSELVSTSGTSCDPECLEPKDTIHPENSSLNSSVDNFDPCPILLDLDSDINPEFYPSEPDIDPDTEVDADLDPRHSDSDSEWQYSNIDPHLDPGSSNFDPGLTRTPEQSGSEPDSDQSDIDPEHSDFDPERDPELSHTDPEYDSDLDQDDGEFSMDTESAEVDSDMFKPLYDGANITICGAYCAIMEFKRACRLPFSAISVLLQLLQLLCPAGNQLPRSVYQLKKFFKKHSSQHNKRTFCPQCHTELNRKQQKCTNAGCQGGEPNSLITLKPDRAISNIFKRKYNTNFWFTL